MSTGQHPKTAITNVRVFDGYRLSEPTTVVMANGLIGSAADTSGAAEYDGQGATLLPGLIECHAHPKEAGELRACLAHGITTVLEMGSPMPQAVRALRAETAAGAASGLPRLFSAELPATAPWSRTGPRTMRTISTRSGSSTT